jgi:hypothetical protein
MHISIGDETGTARDAYYNHSVQLPFNRLLLTPSGRVRMENVCTGRALVCTPVTASV